MDTWRDLEPTEDQKARLLLSGYREPIKTRGEAADILRSLMDEDNPTEKQVAYLRMIGYMGEIKSKNHAGYLIGKMTNRK